MMPIRNVSGVWVDQIFSLFFIFNIFLCDKGISLWCSNEIPCVTRFLWSADAHISRPIKRIFVHFCYFPFAAIKEIEKSEHRRKRNTAKRTERKWPKWKKQTKEFLMRKINNKEKKSAKKKLITTKSELNFRGRKNNEELSNGFGIFFPFFRLLLIIIFSEGEEEDGELSE